MRVTAPKGEAVTHEPRKGGKRPEIISAHYPMALLPQLLLVAMAPMEAILDEVLTIIYLLLCIVLVMYGNFIMQRNRNATFEAVCLFFKFLDFGFGIPPISQLSVFIYIHK